MGKDMVKSDAELVGGLAKARTIALEQRCERGTPWDLACVTIANKIGEQCGYPPIPTDAAPPRPDAFAGLIEASCLLDKRADEYVKTNEPIEEGYRMAARFLRAHVANRSKQMATRTELTINLMKMLVTELEGLIQVLPTHGETIIVADANEWVTGQDHEQEIGDDILFQLFDAIMLRIRSTP